MKKIYLLVSFGVLLVALLTGCKKDQPKPANAIEFNMDGVFNDRSATTVISLDSLTTGGAKRLEIVLYSNSFPSRFIMEFTDESDLDDNCFVGNYQSFNAMAGCNDQISGNCKTFVMYYIDMNNEEFSSSQDMEAYVNISSCDGNYLYGTFSCTLSGTSTPKHITNGKIKGVKITR
jgi:hypothetical protein